MSGIILVMQLRVDWDRCQGHGKCYLTAPDLFEPNDDDEWGRPDVLQPTIDAADGETVGLAEIAVSGCPEQAITLTALAYAPQSAIEG